MLHFTVIFANAMMKLAIMTYKKKKKKGLAC